MSAMSGCLSIKRLDLTSFLVSLSLLLSSLLPIQAHALQFNSAPARIWGHIYAKNQSGLAKQPLPNSSRLSGEVKSEWRVSYTGFPEDAKTAVQFAIDIWSRNFTSSVPIQVEATWENNPNKSVLGSARPGYYFNGFEGAPDEQLWYPSAIANSLAGRDLNPNQKEIFLKVNSSPIWYTGVDGLPGPRSYDLVTVILHEIAHGLGFLSNAEYDRFFGTGYMFQPTPFDAYVQIPDGRTFADFCSRSAELGKAMLGPIFWSGERGIAANFGIKPRLYSPTPYEEGSSITHLDEATFANSLDNALMTPNLGPGEVFRNPGPIALGMIEDIMRKPPSGRASGIPTKLVNARALVGDSYAILTFNSPNCSRVDQVTNYSVKVLPGGETRNFKDTPIRIKGLKNGRTYRFSIVAENEKGKSEPVETNPVKPQRGTTAVEIDRFSRVSNLATIVYRGQRVVIYGDENTQTLKMAKRVGSSWKLSIIRRGVEVGPISICKSGMGKSEAIHVFYGETKRGDLLHSTSSGSKWKHETIDGNGESVQDYREQPRRRTASDVSVSNACAVNRSGLQVFYRDETQGILLGAVQTKSEWSYEIVDGDSDSADRTTGDVAFNLSAITDNSSNTINIIYDSVLRVDSNKSPIEGEVRVATRKSAYPEDWKYRSIDGPEEGNAVAGYATAITQIGDRVVAAWLVSRGDDFPFPTQVVYSFLGDEPNRSSIVLSQFGRPSKPLSIDAKGLSFGCESRICQKSFKASNIKLLSGRESFSNSGQLFNISKARFFVSTLNRKLVWVKADVN